jgi:hypothetical protein
LVGSLGGGSLGGGEVSDGDVETDVGGIYGQGINPFGLPV